MKLIPIFAILLLLINILSLDFDNIIDFNMNKNAFINIIVSIIILIAASRKRKQQQIEKKP